jgi:S-adenosylmethionine synthetase
MSRDNYSSPPSPFRRGTPTRSATGFPTPFSTPSSPKTRGACRLRNLRHHRPVVIGGEVGLSDQDKLKNYMGRIDEIARDCIKDIGYEQDKFHWNTCEC